jgi:hypothetical protein
LSIVHILAGVESGGDLIMKIVDAAILISQEDVGNKIFIAIIERPCTSQLSHDKGLWCERFLKYSIRVNSREGNTQLKDSYELVNKTLLRRPQYFCYTDLSGFYQLTLDLCNKFKIEILFAKQVAEQAIEKCKNNDFFWDFLEKTERDLGNYKKADQLHWRRVKTNSAK